MPPLDHPVAFVFKKRFQATVEKTLNRTAVYRPGGRPKAMGA